MRQQFHDLAAGLFSQLTGNEQATLWLTAEQSDFVRFNHGRVRQAGRVTQADLTLTLVSGQRQTTLTQTLTGTPDHDLALVGTALEDLRTVLQHAPDDPWLALYDSDLESEDVTPGELPPTADMVASVCASAGDLDVVAHLASGTVMRGFASSHGQRNWFERPGFAFDFSVHDSADKAVKDSLAGARFDPTLLERRVRDAAATLAIMRRPAKRLAPGDYDAWLSPAAAAEVLGLLSWGGFGARAHHTRTSPLGRLADGDTALSGAVSLHERPAGGVAPRFGPGGHPRPDAVPLIVEGRMDTLLRSPRSAREFGGETNGAGNGEFPEALAMTAGDLADDQALVALGTGLAVGNLWYLNYSDRNACRMTGMTRFATLWVENGEPVAPVDVMRFDDSLYALLGPKLERLGATAAFLPDSGTYRARSTGSVSLPGWLVRGMTLTL